MGPVEADALFPLVICLALAILLGHWVHCRRIFFLTEATVSLLVGLLAGGGVLAYYSWWKGARLPASIVELDTQIFFDALLPPIIFNAGFSVKKKSFFRNFTTLVLFGVFGTFTTAAMIAAGSYAMLSYTGVGLRHQVSDSLALGTILSSTDSVATLQILDQDAAPVLYSLIFGEGVVNDATSIVLLRAVQNISRKSQLTSDAMLLILASFGRLFMLSLLLGVAVGLASAYLIKRSFVHHSTDREVCLVALLGFVAYLLAEELQLSGIFSVFFAGLTMSHYTWHALSPSAKVVTVYLFRVLSFTSELFLFLYAGFSMWSTTLWQSDLYSRGSLMKSAGILAASMVGLVFAARALTLLPLSLLANTWRPPGSRITLREGAVIWWAGSMRGAVTVALSFQHFASLGSKEPIDNQILVVASNAAVIFITVVLGAVTAPLLGWLIPKEDAGFGTAASMRSFNSGISAPLLATALQRSLHWNTRAPIYRAWHYIDQTWLHPLFGGRRPRAAGYRSPPPSPGKQVIQQVMGPSILKHLGQQGGVATVLQEAAPPASSTSHDGAGTAAAVPTPQPPPPAQAHVFAPGVRRVHMAPLPPSLAASSRHKRRQDPFRLRPAPSDELPPAASGHASSTMRQSAASTLASVPSQRLTAEALDIYPSSALDELFTSESGRLDSQRQQQVDWRDSGEYGEAAWLAAGAPTPGTSFASGSQQQLLLGSLSGQDQDAVLPLNYQHEGCADGGGPDPQAGPPALARKSPFEARSP